MKRISIILILLLILSTLIGCRSSQQQQHQKLSVGSKGFGIEYAELLVMEDAGGGRTLCRILDPWRTERIMMQYLLVPKDDKEWNESEEETFATRYGTSTILRTPLDRMAVTASCHVWLLSQLEALNHVAILCDTVFINAENIKKWMRSNKANGEPTILDGGTATKPNAEVLLSGQCDAIWISPYENASLGNLTMLPIPIIYCAEYMETTPLARAEWMKFYGRLVGCGPKADELFDAVATRYEKLCKGDRKGQKILVDLPYGATWYVPGGNSTSARLYEDAGYVYPWADDSHSGSLSLSKEAVLAKAQDCDIWYIRYMDTNNDWTLGDFKRQNAFFDKFKAAQEGNVWACNTAYSDFFDVTSFRPDSLLESFIQQDGVFYKRVER
ncbi:MAG: ABC transporter substrate-binding protein [Bacteroidales bacterium]|jgi:iron complex transport system substrate-binding protein|nr:ABC transporter substrate-binding protein [Bacteroidales bacterium]